MEWDTEDWVWFTRDIPHDTLVKEKGISNPESQPKYILLLSNKYHDDDDDHKRTSTAVIERGEQC